MPALKVKLVRLKRTDPGTTASPVDLFTAAQVEWISLWTEGVGEGLEYPKQ